MKKLILFWALAHLSAFGQEVGLKNFREFYSSLQVVFDIDPASSSVISDTFSAVYQSLPSTGIYKEFNSSSHWAMYRLVAEFCRARVERDSQLAPEKRWLHRNINFSSSPTAQTDKLNSLMEEYSGLLWARALTVEEKNLFNEHIAAEVKEIGGTVTALKPILVGLCLSMGTSAEFFIRY